VGGGERPVDGWMDGKRQRERERGRWRGGKSHEETIIKKKLLLRKEEIVSFLIIFTELASFSRVIHPPPSHTHTPLSIISSIASERTRSNPSCVGF
jgi:hypothetical protein